MQQNFLKKLTERDFSADLPCWTPHGLIEVRDLESRLCKGDACLAHGGLEISDLVPLERETRANGSLDYIHWTAFWDDRDGNMKA